MHTPMRRAPASVGATFLFAIVLAAGWVAINLAFPELVPSGIPNVVVRPVVHAVMLTGLWLGLSCTDFTAGKRLAIWLAIAVPLTLWLAFIWRLAINGTFQPSPDVTGLPLLPIAILAPIIISLPI